MKKKLLKFGIDFLFLILCQAQVQLDSLRVILNDEKTKYKDRASALNAVAKEFLKTNSDSTLYYANKAYDISDENSLIDYKAQAKLLMGQAFYRTGKLDESFAAFEESKLLARQLGDSSLVASTFYSIGTNYYSTGKYEEALLNFDKSYAISEVISDYKNMAAVLNNVAIINYVQSDLDEGTKNFEKSIEFYAKSDEPLMRSRPLKNLSVLKTREGDYSSAIELNMQSLAIDEEQGDDFAAAYTYVNIANIYFEQDDIDKYIEFTKKSLDLRERLKDKNGMVTCLSNLGTGYSKKNEPQEALSYFNRCLPLARELNLKSSIAHILLQMGGAHLKLDEFDASLNTTKEAFKLFTELDDKQGIGRSYNGFGLYYKKLGRYNEAITNFKKGLQLTKESDIAETNEIALALFEIYEEQGRNREALDSYKLYISTRDSIKSEDNQKQIIRQEYKYEYEKKAIADSISFASEKEIQEARLAKSKNQRQTLIFVLLVVFGFSVVLINRVRVIKKQKGTIESQNQELNSLNHNLEQKVEERTQEIVKVNDDLSKSEERYRLALEASNDGIFDLDVENDVIKYSPALYGMLGYGPYEFPESRQEIYDRIYAEDRTGEHQKKHEEFLRSQGEDGFNDEYRMTKKNGEVIWVQVKAKVVDRNGEGLPLRVVGTHTDITSDKRKTQEMLETVLQTENLERSRISKDIHDGLQQTLTIASLNFQSVKKTISDLSQTAQDKFMTGWKYLQNSIAESRSVAHSLMPKAIIDFGVVSAFENLITEMDQSTEGTSFHFHHNLSSPKLDNEQIEVTLYRILQESINNIIKYAKATAVNVHLTESDNFYTLIIEDNGVGFDTSILEGEKAGMGFKSMKNRLDAINGILDVSSFPGKGTTILVEINAIV